MFGGCRETVHGFAFFALCLGWFVLVAPSFVPCQAAIFCQHLGSVPMDIKVHLCEGSRGKGIGQGLVTGADASTW